MCQAIPRLIVQVAEGRVEVLYEGEPRWMAVNGIPGLAVGEYVIVYAAQVLERMPNDEAEDMLRFLAELDVMLEEASR